MMNNRTLWLLFRIALGVGAGVLAFVDGLGTFLSPGQALANAFNVVHPHAPDPRWGMFLGLVLYAGLAFASVIARAWSAEQER